MPLEFAAGWRSIPLHSTSPAPQSRSVESRPADEDLVEVVFRHGTTIKHQGRVREYRSGQRAWLPDNLAGPMFSVGTLNCADPKEPERHGFRRRCMADGREVRSTRGLHELIPSPPFKPLWRVRSAG